jgi:hypothetical protein
MVKYTINNPIPVNFTDNKFSIYSADRLLYSINTLDFKKKIRLYIPSEYTSFITKIGYVSNNNKLLLT